MAVKENYRGQPMGVDLKTLKREWSERVLPLALQDMYAAVKEEGLVGAIVAPTTFFGETVSSYPPSISQQLGAIPKYKGLTPPQVYEIQQFNREIEKARDFWRQQYQREVGFDAAARRLGEMQGKDSKMVDWTIRLNSSKFAAQQLNPEWVKFVAQHLDELMEQGRYENNIPNYIIDEQNRLKAAGVQR